MFAPKVAKPQTQATASAATRVERSIGNQATLRRVAQRATNLRESELHGHDEQEADLASLTAAAPPIVQKVLREPGQPLDQSSRAFFEPRFGFNFGSIRIHTDANAALSADAVRALGYTVGNHIVFGAGQYQPATPKGRQLLAHELAHAVQQRSRNTPDSEPPIGNTSGSYEREADEAAQAVFDGRAFELGPVNGPILARKTSEGVHDSEELGDAARAFMDNNSNLGTDTLSKIRSGIYKLASESGTYEVAYSFFNVYSHFNNSIRQMTPLEEEKEKSLGNRLAVTDTTLGFTTTTLQSVVLGYGDTQLATLLLHELSHTGHVGGSVAGEGAYQEGQSYGLEYFYAEIAGDTNRTEKIRGIVSAGDVLGYSKAASLPRFQEDFKVTYALMTALREVVTNGSSSHLPFPDLTSARAQLLEEQVVTSFQSPGTELAKYIAYVRSNLASFKIPPL